MVQKIIRLSEEVINKIAAGEVVENPATIAKELIENSLDAGASRIDLAIEGGGERLLKIEDDGWGMSREDALLSLERHATSKIRTERDLSSLVTMGFRGEALAAIAAVSRLEMRTSDGEVGTRIEKGVAEPCARNRGTTLVVQDLFYNTPARKKFMKSSSANTAALTRMVETIALANPEIAFSLMTDGKVVLKCEPEEKKKRIEAILYRERLKNRELSKEAPQILRPERAVFAGGKGPSEDAQSGLKPTPDKIDFSITSGIDPMPHEVRGAGIWGLLSAPDEAKIHRRGQYLFINKRPVFSPLVSRAVKMGYGTRIAESSYPSFVLFLDIDPEEVDVNVHPQKKEVRFRDEGKVFRIVEQAVASAFESPSFTRALTFSQPSFSLAEVSPPPPKPAAPPSFDFAVAERPLAIVEGYFFLEREGLLLIDLSRAHARVLYESLKEKKGGIQPLLWPIEVAIEDFGVVEELQAMRIECRLIGKRTLAVDALPALLEPADFPDFLNAWVKGKKLDAAAAKCVGKKKFTIDEAALLWKELLKCRETLYDPCGKKIWEKIDRERLKHILEGA